MSKKSYLSILCEDRGFDLSEHVPFTKQYKVKCSQCATLCINGVACHETGCPNARRKHHTGLGEFSEEEEE